MKTCTKKLPSTSKDILNKAGTIKASTIKASTKGTIKFQVKKITVKGKQYYEAICSIDGLKPTKLSKVDTDCTLFENKSGIVSACNARANKLSCKSCIILPVE